MKINIKVLISAILLVTAFSCKTKKITFNSNYIEGKWTYYRYVENQNGSETEHEINAPFRVEYKENGTYYVFGSKNRFKWKITKNNKLIVRSKERTFKSTLVIESDTKMKLIRIDTNDSLNYTCFYYERGWN